MKQITIVEDDTLMRAELVAIISKAGYKTGVIEVFHNVAKQVIAIAPDLVILDINLPEMNGFQICREIKQRSAIPVLVLTSRDQMRDEVHALELGADEYLTKPCRAERLLARIANVQKRYEGRKNLLEGNGFLLDKNTYTLYVNGKSVVLPSNQGRILEVFISHKGMYVTKEELSIGVWGTLAYIDENALQVNLTRLKKNMQSLKMAQKITYVRGKGYTIGESS